MLRKMSLPMLKKMEVKISSKSSECYDDIKFIKLIKEGDYSNVWLGTVKIYKKYSFLNLNPRISWSPKNILLSIKCSHYVSLGE